MDDAISTRSDTLFEEKPSLTVIDRVAELEGEDPVDLTPPLYDAIDPEALDSLFQSSRFERAETVETVQFTYLGYDVRVQSGGEVIVADTDSARARSTE
ncbi:hypothetical protein OB955_01460 [Halobacteria archaeon AArc-m2/3/4]|uniref:Halobacterial output domain-containing protein n=1 Tax=Natronoglomus mannanivorans TaxID=2979990 RepID=A0ABT2Q918_9EURY|nr:hypothetical protein [Halobacteria archaeon AArc-m2/3/4]